MFSLIAAVDANYGIGKDGRLPWHLPSDLAYFHRITEGAGRNVVIMGRTTWESIPEKFRPLKNRLNTVLTRNADYQLAPGVLRGADLDEALEKVAHASEKNDGKNIEIFIIGGAQIFAEAVKHRACQRIYLTEIHGKFDCDTFFPKFDKNIFKKISHSELQEENGVQFEFAVYEK